MQELSDAGVYATMRMVASTQSEWSKMKPSERLAQRVEKKGGNPALLGSQKVRAKDNLRDNLEPTPSSSSSFHLLLQLTLTNTSGRIFWKTHLFQSRFRGCLGSVGKAFARARQTANGTSSEAQLFKLADFDVEEAIEMVRYSIAQGAKNLITNGDHNRTESVRGHAFAVEFHRLRRAYSVTNPEFEQFVKRLFTAFQICTSGS